jgi:hypothetical protein
MNQFDGTGIIQDPIQSFSRLQRNELITLVFEVFNAFN